MPQIFMRLLAAQLATHSRLKALEDLIAGKLPKEAQKGWRLILDKHSDRLLRSMLANEVAENKELGKTLKAACQEHFNTPF